MPYSSDSQRRKFHAMEARGEISPKTVKEWDRASKGKKLPEKVKKAHDLGVLAALVSFGLKTAGEELRLKLPKRSYHGYDAALRAEAERGHKKAGAPPAETASTGALLEGYGDKRDADTLEELLQQLDAPSAPGDQKSSKDPLDRTVSWGAATNPEAGDTGTRVVDPQGPSIGMVW